MSCACKPSRLCHVGRMLRDTKQAAFDAYLEADDFATRGRWLRANKAFQRHFQRQARDQAREREMQRLAALARNAERNRAARRRAKLERRRAA